MLKPIASQIQNGHTVWINPTAWNDIGPAAMDVVNDDSGKPMQLIYETQLKPGLGILQAKPLKKS